MRVGLLFLFTAAVFLARVVIALDSTDESRAIEKIELLGGKVEELAPSNELSGLKVNLNSTQMMDVSLKELSKLRNLTTVVITGTKITDAGLKELRGLKNLTLLNLNRTRTTATGQKRLKECLPNTQIRP